MTAAHKKLISVVVPVYNEADGLKAFHRDLLKALEMRPQYAFEILYCDDGSSDATPSIVSGLAVKNSKVCLLRLTRNFGKEIATTAGLHNARGKAVITIDGDGEHPPSNIPDFIFAWEEGSKVVIGKRHIDNYEGIIKSIGSKLFYWLMRRFSGVNIVPRSTDFRLIDRSVLDLFITLTEHNRMTRGLIDWLGYKAAYIEFSPSSRKQGRARYTFIKLFKLAIDSIIASSPKPLYFIALLGALVLPLSTLLGSVMLVNALSGDPLHWHATGTAYLSVLLLFLIGLILLSQGIFGLYLSHIHSETQNRPLYIIDKEVSIGL